MTPLAGHVGTVQVTAGQWHRVVFDLPFPDDADVVVLTQLHNGHHRRTDLLLRNVDSTGFDLAAGRAREDGGDDGDAATEPRLQWDGSRSWLLRLRGRRAILGLGSPARRFG